MGNKVKPSHECKWCLKKKASALFCKRGGNVVTGKTGPVCLDCAGKPTRECTACGEPLEKVAFRGPLGRKCNSCLNKDSKAAERKRRLRSKSDAAIVGDAIGGSIKDLVLSLIEEFPCGTDRLCARAHHAPETVLPVLEELVKEGKIEKKGVSLPWTLVTESTADRTEGSPPAADSSSPAAASVLINSIATMLAGLSGRIESITTPAITITIPSFTIKLK
jgi:hypothetical protein